MTTKSFQTDNIYLALGSNLGDKKKSINKALELLKDKWRIIKISKLYETEPVGYKNQDWFLNCVIQVKTSLKPKKLFLFLQLIEKKLKRFKKIKNGPRTIDQDILFYEDKIISEKDL